MSLRIITLASVFALFGACSSTIDLTPLAAELVDVELFMSRGSLTRSDFETYKLQDDSLFVEYGPIVGGRFKPSSQDFITLTEELQAQLAASARESIELHTSREWMLDEPGRANSFADPGQYFLTVTLEDGSKHTLRTSLDTVSEPSSALTRQLRDFAIALRASAPEAPCGNREFYGIPVKDKGIHKPRLS